MSNKWQLNCMLPTELVEKLDYIYESDRRYFNRTHLIECFLSDCVEEWEEENGEIETEEED